MAETANPTPVLLSPKLDVVFKCLFAPEPALLADLLNAILPLDGYAEVAELQVRNPDVDRETISAKQIVLDIRAVDASGRQMNAANHCLAALLRMARAYRTDLALDRPASVVAD